VNPSIVLKDAISTFASSFSHSFYVATSTKSATGTSEQNCSHIGRRFCVVKRRDESGQHRV
jgi:hypothetical protein